MAYSGYVAPCDMPDCVIKNRKSRFYGLTVAQRDTVLAYERQGVASVFVDARVIRDALPKEQRVHGDTVYVPPSLTVGRHLLRFHAGGWVSTAGLKNCVRSKIHEFSRASQNRLRIAMEEYFFTPRFFITLTFPPAVAPKDMEKAFYMLRDFCRCADRLTVGKKPIWFWKKEFQRNGNVHYHLCTSAEWDLSRYEGDTFVKFPKGYNRKAKKEYVVSVGADLSRHVKKGLILRLQDIWSRIIGHNARNSLDISAVLSESGVSQYMAKYVSKDSQTDCPADIDDCGRWWGIINRSLYSRVPMAKYDLTDGLSESNCNATVSSRSTIQRLFMEFLHDFLDSDKYYKLWRTDLATKKYVKNEWFLPKDRLKLHFLERFFLTYFPLCDIFVDRVVFSTGQYGRLLT